MCGICGIYNLTAAKMPEKRDVERMLEKIRHRGPDQSRAFAAERFAFGFNRLSFIDLENGMQPLQNEDRTVTMVCNGEIYNYKEWRETLLARGHRFRTETDVEVILHLYEEYGTDFPEKLNGQFAIALYDGKTNQLLLVRDQIGICPLFYTVADGRVLFASEIKALLEYSGVERRLNLKAVDQLMNFPGVVSPETFFAGIHALEAGHMLRCLPGGKMENLQYWDLVYGQEEEDLGEEYYVERLREMLREAIRRRLVADVPIGFYISGGLDSSVVACYIGNYMLDSYYSFSAEMAQGDLDESAFQQIVRECVKSKHYSTEVAEAQLWDNLYQVIYHAESAVKESYDVAAFLLSGLVQSSPAKAVLTGQGSDEFFYGYVGYMVDGFRDMQKGKMSREECECNERLWGDPYFRYERNHPQIREMHRKLYSRELRGETERFSAIAESPVHVERLKGLSSQKRRSYIDYKLRLSDHLLGEHGDRMFFAHSVEGRHPFLDKDLLEFVITIPDKYKLNGVNEKYILKRAAEGIVPDKIIKRRKFPFQTPGMSAMIKKSEEIPLLSREIIARYGIFDPEYVQELAEIYRRENFRLMGAYEIDYLLIVLTVTMLCEQYKLSV